MLDKAFTKGRQNPIYTQPTAVAQMKAITMEKAAGILDDGQRGPYAGKVKGEE
jgi:hypothetical protein